MNPVVVPADLGSGTLVGRREANVDQDAALWQIGPAFLPLLTAPVGTPSIRMRASPIDKYVGGFIDLPSGSISYIPGASIVPAPIQYLPYQSEHLLAITWFPVIQLSDQGQVLTAPAQDISILAEEADAYVWHSLGWHDRAEEATDREWSLATNADLADEFNRLVAEWRANTMMFSSPAALAMDRSYQRLIGLGRPAVPLILNELKRRADHWFWALVAITGEDPAAGAADLESARQAWLEWGRAHDLVE